MFEEDEDYRKAKSECKARITKAIKVWSGREEAIRDASFEDGAKFGYHKAIEWHDLRKDPDDLPTDKHYKITSDGDIALYDYFWEKWYDLRSDELTYHPAAWCEIPRFK